MAKADLQYLPGKHGFRYFPGFTDISLTPWDMPCVLADGMQSYISHEGFVAKDGEQVALEEFSSEEELRAWATHPDYVEAKKRRDTFSPNT
ncbi:hypothetical protein ACO0K9_22055 [Undibacterium sp. Ji50W]|uniref:hypothetical protein n=1 Tax=Undibacterium sp. Ji50W TaxID=3413041 RepID=UPI003BF06A42